MAWDGTSSAAASDESPPSPPASQPATSSLSPPPFRLALLSFSHRCTPTRHLPPPPIPRLSSAPAPLYPQPTAPFRLHGQLRHTSFLSLERRSPLTFIFSSESASRSFLPPSARANLSRSGTPDGSSAAARDAMAAGRPSYATRRSGGGELASARVDRSSGPPRAPLPRPRRGVVRAQPFVLSEQGAGV